MKKIIFISIAAIVLLSSCQKHERIHPSGYLVTHTFTLSNLFPWSTPQENSFITGIDIFDMAADLQIYISEDEEEDDKITIIVDDNVYPHINRSAFGSGQFNDSGELIAYNYTINLQYGHVSFMGRKPNLTIILNVKTLERIGLSGASTSRIEDTLFCKNLEIHLRGASTLRAGQIEANNIVAVLSGASRMDLSGQCETLDLTLSGASSAFGYGMVCDNLKAVFSGASRGEFTVLKTLSATLSGASTLYYRGNPTITYLNTSGSSRLEKR